MKRYNPFFAPLLFAVILTIGGCGDGTVKFGGVPDNDDDLNVSTVTGDLDDIIPVSTRDVLVFVFTDLVTETVDVNVGRGVQTHRVFNTFADGEVAVIESGSDQFTVNDVLSGAITVVFLLDNPGDAADGQIDNGDPIAILTDPDGDLENVRSLLTVTIDDIDVNFTGASTVVGQHGTAIPDEIRKTNSN